jgi:hypothetical protein
MTVGQELVKIIELKSAVIVGYFEKGYSGNVTVKISSKGSEGFLDFDVDEDISVH